MQLGRQADAATLVAAQVDDHAAALGGDQVERALQLLAAVAAARAEHVAGQALRVHAHERGVVATELTEHERDVLEPLTRSRYAMARKVPCRSGIRASHTRSTSTC